MSSGKGVGALDAFAAASLRDAISSAASEAHADAAAVLAEAPPTTIFLRPSPGGDGGDDRENRYIWSLRVPGYETETSE